MKQNNKWITTLVITAMLMGSTSDISGHEYCTDCGGCAYEDAYQSCCMAPAIGFGIAAIAAIIAVGVHNRSKSSHSSHSHSSSSSSSGS